MEARKSKKMALVSAQLPGRAVICFSGKLKSKWIPGAEVPFLQRQRRKSIEAMVQVGGVSGEEGAYVARVWP